MFEHSRKAYAELGGPPPSAAFDRSGRVDERAVEVEHDGREHPGGQCRRFRWRCGGRRCGQRLRYPLLISRLEISIADTLVMISRGAATSRMRTLDGSFDALASVLGESGQRRPIAEHIDELTPGAEVSVDLSGHGVVNADWHTSRPTLVEDMANRGIERPVGMGWGTAEGQGQIRRADIDPIDPW